MIPNFYIMEPDEVKELIQAGIVDAHVEVVDTTGTKDHFSAIVISDTFLGKNMVQQHQIVYKALGSFMTNEIHALQLKTMTPEQWKENN
ncbi:MAG: BolA/IbaG family iron-sulfur metabolism protein [Candidatus Marinimicrobia bacterium]|nr:BolA/IbaG family iron-sulfur metabolism protein [Candidatus Neomarinimicrobiota bacterium]MDP7127621.1 BolA/IbaG family iron-sulfur metabolism protein [Candidatus Neomarinimicrobiota bacterium]HJL74575.1 BolA/IbaG family iron-sulfur metabolism protein [Candidatus Neomarinimicrobiota bacterium]|tara:strand:- start:294 stop:560 length:267 start_codon:yes stop_codon:yes gene_type:complete